MTSSFVFIIVFIFLIGIVYTLFCNLILKKKTNIFLYTIFGIVLFTLFWVLSGNHIFLMMFTIMIVLFLIYVNYKMKFRIVLNASVLLVMVLSIIITILITLPKAHYTQMFDTEDAEFHFRQHIEKIILMDENYVYGENEDYINSLNDKTFTNDDFELYKNEIIDEVDHFLKSHMGVLRLEIKEFGGDVLYEYRSSEYDRLRFLEGDKYDIFQWVFAYNSQGYLRPHTISLSGFSVTQIVGQLVGIIGFISIFIFACLFGEILKFYFLYIKSSDKAKFVLNHLLHSKFRKETDIQEVEDYIYNHYLELCKDYNWPIALKMAIESFGNLGHIAFETKSNKVFYGSSIIVAFITILTVLYIFMNPTTSGLSFLLFGLLLVVFLIWIICNLAIYYFIKIKISKLKE